MNTSSMVASIIFSSIGLAAFVYGKKVSSFKALVIGIVLMSYTFFVTNNFLVYGIGVVLTAALFVNP